MRTWGLASLFLLVASCGQDDSDPGSAQNSVATQASVEAVKAANAAKDEAMIARDPTRLASFYTDDYRVIDQRAEVHDKRNQVEFMTRNVELLRAVSDDVQVTMLSPEAALVTGRLTGRYRMDGEEADFVERYTGIWIRQGQDWRVRHEHGSTAPGAD